MIQAMGGMPPIYRPPQPPIPEFRPGGGAGNHSRIMQFLAGNPLNQMQLARMSNGQAPGGFHGAFSGINPAVLMQLAQMLHQGGGQLQGGQPPVFHPGQGGQLPFRTIGGGGPLQTMRIPSQRGFLPPKRMNSKLPLIPLRGLG